MQDLLTVMTTAAGLLFSISCAVLIEELIVGGFFRMFFVNRAEAATRDKQS